jgi:hypothetical protein
MTDPMAGLEGTSSAIRFDMDVFGLSLVEHNPGVKRGLRIARRLRACCST